MTLDPHYQFRDALTKFVIDDLIGPAGGESELIPDPPITRYTAGILYPQDAGPLSAEMDDTGLGNYAAGELPDPPVAMANVQFPMSMGLTFAVDPSRSSSIRVTVDAARYEPDDAGWRRRAITTHTEDIDVTRPNPEATWTVADGLELYGRVRKADRFGAVSVTLALVNRIRHTSGLRDGNSFFQPRIHVTTPAASSPAFRARVGEVPPDADPDLLSFELLYRHAHGFAVGHGCSAKWTQLEPDDDFATSVSTEYAPQHELPLAFSNPEIDCPVLTMKTLVTTDRTAVVAGLEELCRQYEAWVTTSRTQISEVPEPLRPTAQRHLDACGQALVRMRAGIALLDQDELVWRAFRLAAGAMLQQRARSAWIKSGCPDGGPQLSDKHRWYPFQLAFVLLCLRGVAEPTSDDRRFTDLLWFPTGGGKTEAYLALIAFTLFLRRLRNRQAGGLTAIMRYTMRLLTIQQFERATMLMCACESVRRTQEHTLGRAPFTVGLWVGRGATPQNRKTAATSIKQLRTGAVLLKDNPVQLHRCPWCGTRLTAYNYWLSGDKKALRVDCKHDGCEFSGGKGLPVLPPLTVDRHGRQVCLDAVETGGRRVVQPGRPPCPPARADRAGRAASHFRASRDADRTLRDRCRPDVHEGRNRAEDYRVHGHHSSRRSADTGTLRVGRPAIPTSGFGWTGLLLRDRSQTSPKGQPRIPGTHGARKEPRSSNGAYVRGPTGGGVAPASAGWRTAPGQSRRK